MYDFIFVGLGGALGAMLRYAISLLPFRGSFPFLTLITNLIGAVAVGFIVGVAVRKDVTENTLLFLKVGFCGGFTTFSTFSLESFALMKSGHYRLMSLYIILSVALCISGIFAGMFIGKRIGC